MTVAYSNRFPRNLRYSIHLKVMWLLNIVTIMIPLKSMLTLAVKETEFKARAKGLELILHDTDEKAYFDSKWTLEAICNILDNALKYTNEGTISLLWDVLVVEKLHY